MEAIRSLETTSFENLYNSFKEAFSDYEVQVNKEEFNAMLTRRGFVPSLSFGLFVDDHLKSFILNGLGEYNGVYTAYDTGTGTVKEFRGMGYATTLFNFGLPILRNAGVSQYLLEVLQHNIKAISVYKNLGFTVNRSFNYHVQQISLVRIPYKETPSEYKIQEISVEHLNGSNFGDFNPSWQNSCASIKRRVEDFRFFGGFDGENLTGYCIFEPNSGDITQIAVERDHRRKGIGTLLLKEALRHIKHPSVKVINTEVRCGNITEFLATFGIPLAGKQFEMIRKI